MIMLAIVFSLIVISLLVILNFYLTYLIRVNSGIESSSFHDINFKYELYPEDMKPIIQQHNLDSVLNKSTDLEITLSAMKWIYNNATHTSNPKFSQRLTSHDILKGIDLEKPKINCWMYSIVLNDLLLAKGIPSRIIHLRPKDFQSIDSHIVVSAFLKGLNKWIFLDPNYNAYLTDENGVILSIEEIRSKIVCGEKILTNNEAKYIGDEPINNFLTAIMGNKYYISYLKKNLFRYSTPLYSTFYKKSRSETPWVHFVNKEFVDYLLQIEKIKGHDIITQSKKAFWKKP